MFGTEAIEQNADWIARRVAKDPGGRNSRYRDVAKLDSDELFRVARKVAHIGLASGRFNPADSNSFGNLEGYVRYELEEAVRRFLKNRPAPAKLVPVGNVISDDEQATWTEEEWARRFDPPSQREYSNPVMDSGLTLDQLMTRVMAERMMRQMTEADFGTLAGYFEAGNFRAMANMLGISIRDLHQHIQAARIHAIELITRDEDTPPSPVGPWPSGRGADWQAHCAEMTEMFERVRAERERRGTLKPREKVEAA